MCNLVAMLLWFSLNNSCANVVHFLCLQHLTQGMLQNHGKISKKINRFSWTTNFSNVKWRVHTFPPCDDWITYGVSFVSKSAIVRFKSFPFWMETVSVASKWGNLSLISSSVNMLRTNSNWYCLLLSGKQLLSVDSSSDSSLSSDALYCDHSINKCSIYWNGESVKFHVDKWKHLVFALPDFQCTKDYTAFSLFKRQKAKKN